MCGRFTLTERQLFAYYLVDVYYGAMVVTIRLLEFWSGHGSVPR